MGCCHQFWTAIAPLRKESKEHSCSSFCEVITASSLDFDKFSYFQLWICFDHRIFTAGKPLEETSVGHTPQVLLLPPCSHVTGKSQYLQFSNEWAKSNQIWKYTQLLQMNPLSTPRQLLVTLLLHGTLVLINLCIFVMHELQSSDLHRCFTAPTGVHCRF